MRRAAAGLWRAAPGGSAARPRRPPAQEEPPLPPRARGSEILFGVAPCAMALAQARRAFFGLYVQRGSGAPRAAARELCLQAAARGVPVRRLPARSLGALCRGQHHQGVCLEATPLRSRRLEEAAEEEEAAAGGRARVWLALERVQDPMNLGALLRSAYFLGVDRVVSSRRNSCPLTPTVSKASSGAMEVFDVYSTDNFQDFLKTKTAEGWEVVGTVSSTEAAEDVPVVNCLEFQWSKPIILVIGNEGDGLSLETQRLCHRMLIVPPGRALCPGIESLNVSVAAGILLHSICSRKPKHSD
ncbi:rRNA methyltransferase 1, mitochondrial [Eudromia elegans]